MDPCRREIMTLLRQIQDELASSDMDVAAVLRKCKILARRLHSDRERALRRRLQRSERVPVTGT